MRVRSASRLLAMGRGEFSGYPGCEFVQALPGRQWGTAGIGFALISVRDMRLTAGEPILVRLSGHLHNDGQQISA